MRHLSLRTRHIIAPIPEICKTLEIVARDRPNSSSWHKDGDCLRAQATLTPICPASTVLLIQGVGAKGMTTVRKEDVTFTPLGDGR